MGNLHYKLNLDPGKTNEVFHHNMKENPKISVCNIYIIFHLSVQGSILTICKYFSQNINMIFLLHVVEIRNGFQSSSFDSN